MVTGKSRTTNWHCSAQRSGFFRVVNAFWRRRYDSLWTLTGRISSPNCVKASVSNSILSAYDVRISSPTLTDGDLSSRDFTSKNQNFAGFLNQVHLIVSNLTNFFKTLKTFFMSFMTEGKQQTTNTMQARKRLKVLPQGNIYMYYFCACILLHMYM